jgi:hypothetical protein
VSTLTVAQTTLEGLGPEPTLDDVLDAVWRELRSHHTAECPVCHGEMGPEYGAQALPLGGRCRDCGALLS